MVPMERSFKKLLTLVIAALLCAVGIIIPMFAPKIVLEPMSFTLASHVPIFIAMFISAPVAVAVTIGTSLGFFFAGLPPVVALRALSHIGFVLVGCFLLKKFPDLLAAPSRCVLFGLLLSVIHALCETVVVTLFYFGGRMGGGFYAKGYVASVLLLVGFGTIVHSMVDYGISLAVWKPVSLGIPIPVLARPRRKAAAQK
mgnify:FL=1